MCTVGQWGAMPREGGSATNRWSIKQLQSYYHCTSGHIYSIQTFSYEVFLRCLILLKFSHKTLSPLILICTSCETLLKFVVKKQMGMNGVSGEALRRGFTVALEITTNFVQHQPSSLEMSLKPPPCTRPKIICILKPNFFFQHLFWITHIDRNCSIVNIEQIANYEIGPQII